MKHSRFLILMLGIMAHFNGYAQGYDMEVDGIYYTYDVDAETATVTSAAAAISAVIIVSMPSP